MHLQLSHSLTNGIVKYMSPLTLAFGGNQSWVLRACDMKFHLYVHTNST